MGNRTNMIKGSKKQKMQGGQNASAVVNNGNNVHQVNGIITNIVAQNGNMIKQTIINKNGQNEQSVKEVISNTAAVGMHIGNINGQMTGENAAPLFGVEKFVFQEFGNVNNIVDLANGNNKNEGGVEPGSFQKFQQQTDVKGQVGSV